MRSPATPALLLVLAALSGCALSHERAPHPTPFDGGTGIDAGLPDLGGLPDFSVPFDLGSPPDGGDARSCTERWASLPYCPADPSMAIGRPCSFEGQDCGACCLPGPALLCTGGVWTVTTAPECRGILCPAFPHCGTGICAPGAVCLRVATEFVESERCVPAPFMASSCGGVPDGWLSDDPRTCQLCSCAESSDPIGPTLHVTLDCPCCDDVLREDAP